MGRINPKKKIECEKKDLTFFIIIQILLDPFRSLDPFFPVTQQRKYILYFDKLFQAGKIVRKLVTVFLLGLKLISIFRFESVISCSTANFKKLEKLQKSDCFINRSSRLEKKVYC